MHVGIYEIENPEESAFSMYEKAKVAMDTIKGDYSINLVYYRTEMLLKKIEKQQSSCISGRMRATETFRFR